MEHSHLKTVYKFYASIQFFLMGSLLAALLYFPLGWGLMDDEGNLRAIHTRWKGLSLGQVLRKEPIDVIFRPVYTVFNYIGYNTFDHCPHLFYIAVFGFVLLSLLPWVLLLRRHVRKSVPGALLLFGFFLLSATPLYNLIVYLSLQEKFVICFGGWSMWALDSALRVERSNIRSLFWHALALLSFLLGTWGKPTTLAFAPWACLAIFMSTSLSFPERVILLASWCAVAGGMAFVFLHNPAPYTSSYATHLDALVHALKTQPLMLYVLVLLGLTTAGVIIFQMQPKTRFFQTSLPSPLVWPVTLLTYLALLIPWGIAKYLYAPAMVLASGCLVVLIDQCRERTWMEQGLFCVLPISTLMAVLIVFKVAIPRIARQAEIPQVVHWLSQRIPNPQVDIFVMEPCYEARAALQDFTDEKQTLLYMKKSDTPTFHRPTAWLITRDECPADNARLAEFKEIIFQLPHWTIYEKSTSRRNT